MLFLSLVMRKHKIFQGCAVAKLINRCIYYFELPQDYDNSIDSWSKGIYSSVGYMGGYFVGWQSTLARQSTRVWQQGPKGGVKIVKGRGRHGYGYVTKDEGMMKKFMWVKLSAQTLK